MKGFINRYDRIKGFGFITTIEGEEVFFHVKDMIKTILAVEFDMEKTEKGLRATNVKRAKKEKEKDE